MSPKEGPHLGLGWPGGSPSPEGWCQSPEQKVRNKVLGKAKQEPVLSNQQHIAHTHTHRLSDRLQTRGQPNSNNSTAPPEAGTSAENSISGDRGRRPRQNTPGLQLPKEKREKSTFGPTECQEELCRPKRRPQTTAQIQNVTRNGSDWAILGRRLEAMQGALGHRRIGGQKWRGSREETTT